MVEYNKYNVHWSVKVLILFLIVLISCMGFLSLNGVSYSAFADTTYTYDDTSFSYDYVSSGDDVVRQDSGYAPVITFYWEGSDYLSYQLELIDYMCMMSRANNFSEFYLTVDITFQDVIFNDEIATYSIVELAHTNGMTPTYTVNSISTLYGDPEEFGTYVWGYNMREYLNDFLMDYYYSEFTSDINISGEISIAIYKTASVGSDECYYRSNYVDFDYTFNKNYSDLIFVEPASDCDYSGGLYLDSSFTTLATSPSTLASGTTVYIGSFYHTRYLYFYVDDELFYTLEVANNTNFNTLDLTFLDAVECAEGYEFNPFVNVVDYLSNDSITDFDESDYVVTSTMRFYCTIDRIVCTITFYVEGEIYDTMEVYYGTNLNIILED